VVVINIVAIDITIICSDRIDVHLGNIER
jgi:hypothetical protein